MPTIRITSPQDGYICDMSTYYPLVLGYTLKNNTESFMRVYVKVYFDDALWSNDLRSVYGGNNDNEYTCSIHFTNDTSDAYLSDGEHVVFVEVWAEAAAIGAMATSNAIKIYKNAKPPVEELEASKSSYIGVNNTARLITKMYIGVNGKARKVKKAYIGVNEKARLWYNSTPAIQNIPATSIEVYSSTSYVYPNRTYSMEARVKPANCTKVPRISVNLSSRYGKATLDNSPTIGTNYVSYPITIRTTNYGYATGNDYFYVEISSSENDSTKISTRKSIYLEPRGRTGYTVQDYEILYDDELCKVEYTNGSIRYFNQDENGYPPDGSTVYTGYYTSEDPSDTTFKHVFWDSGVNPGEIHYF